MKYLAVECPCCREWMSLSEFHVQWGVQAGLTVEGEIECPVPECGLVFSIEGGVAVYRCPEKPST
ncbi:MAG TPA: hypothetical protein VHU19_14305 [Pyrinomonadaceae bacterium]|jgi:hypothetical protein|nr:hypothetical protein [Pyrinomonadaceae bacterium]